VLSDDTVWAQQNLENITQNIYFIGIQENSSNQSLSSTDQVGKKSDGLLQLLKRVILKKKFVTDLTDSYENVKNRLQNRGQFNIIKHATV
jgi:hypothetical protein